MTRLSRTLPSKSKKQGVQSTLAITFITLCFFPYLALPMGNSTNVPLAAIAGTMLSVRLLANPRILIVLMLGIIFPFLATLLRLVGGISEVNPNSYITSPFAILTVFGAASAVQILGARIIKVIILGVLVSAAIAIVQKYWFLDRGIVPWLEMYNVPGYASVASNAEVIGLYIKRPFGLFPEPSFLAGTLALAIAAILLLSSADGARLGRAAIAAAAVGVFVIFISDSGSGIICIVLLAVAGFILAFKKHRGTIFVLPFVLAAAIWLASAIAANRQGAGNTSWNDRLASITAGYRLLTSDPLYLLVGVGRGMVPELFRDRGVFGGMTVYSAIPDIYSVLGRVVIESGLLFGLPIVIGLCILLVKAVDNKTSFLGMLLLGLWLVVCGLTISYETASWIWTLPGLALGLILHNRASVERI